MATSGPKDEPTGDDIQIDPTLQIARGLVEASYHEITSEVNPLDLHNHQTRFKDVVSNTEVSKLADNNLERWKNIARQLQTVRETLHLLQENMKPGSVYHQIPEKPKVALDRLRHWCGCKFKTPDDFATFEGLYENTLRSLMEQEGLITNYFSSISQFCGHMRHGLQKVREAELNPDYLILIWSSYEHLLIQKVTRARLQLDDYHHPVPAVDAQASASASASQAPVSFRPPPDPPKMPYDHWQTQIAQGAAKLNAASSSAPKGKEPATQPKNIAMMDEIRQKATRFQTSLSGVNIEQHFRSLREDFAATKPTNPEQSLLSDIRRRGSASSRGHKSHNIEDRIAELKRHHLTEHPDKVLPDDQPQDPKEAMLTQFQDAIMHRRHNLKSDDENSSDEDYDDWSINDVSSDEDPDSDSESPEDELPERMSKLKLSQ